MEIELVQRLRHISIRRGATKLKTVHVMVGIPASGKSTISKKREYRNPKSIRLSSDEIRMSLATDNNVEVFEKMNAKLRKEIDGSEYDNIYYDATNINRRRRRSLYRNIKSWNKDIHVNIIFMSIPYATAIVRNSLRDENSQVPDDVILRMHRQLQIPRIGVDCDSIEITGIPIFSGDVDMYVRDIDKVENAFKYMNSQWAMEIALSDTPHDCLPWHKESVFEHINMAISNSSTQTMKEISLFHDLGKGICKVKDKTGYATYRNHADVGAHYHLNFTMLTKRQSLEAERDLEVGEAIHQHMNFHNKLGRKNIINNRLTDEVIKLACEFSKIDSVSKIYDN